MTRGQLAALSAFSYAASAAFQQLASALDRLARDCDALHKASEVRRWEDPTQ